MDSKKTILNKRLITGLLLSCFFLIISIVRYSQSATYKESSLSRDLYCGTFSYFDKTCDANNIWIAKTENNNYELVRGTENTIVLDKVGARTVIDFNVSSQSNGQVCTQTRTLWKMGLNGADGINGTNGTNGADGAPGADGINGTNGTNGADGVCTPGDTGPQGIQGENGPQGIQGENGPQGIQGIQGIQGLPGTTNGSFGSFYDTTSQTGNADTVLTMRLSHSDPWNNGVSLTNGSKITIANPGVYNIAFSAQMVKTSGNSTTNSHIWLSQNGTDIPFSASQIGFPANSVYYVPAWNFYVKTTVANEYVQLKWEIHSNLNNAISLQEVPATGNVPAIPSVIVTVNQVGQ